MNNLKRTGKENCCLWKTVLWVLFRHQLLQKSVCFKNNIRTAPSPHTTSTASPRSLFAAQTHPVAVHETSPSLALWPQRSGTLHASTSPIVSPAFFIPITSPYICVSSQAQGAPSRVSATKLNEQTKPMHMFEWRRMNDRAVSFANVSKQLIQSRERHGNHTDSLPKKQLTAARRGFAARRNLSTEALFESDVA